MTNAVVKTTGKPQLSVKTQTLATIAAIIAAVALPQLFHLMGAVSGLGTALGETFLPMHLPILLVGLLAGPYAGAAAGICAPLVSHALSGMPGSAMLPFMMAELCVYGMSAGLLRNAKMYTAVKVIISQIAGRLFRAALILLAVYVIGTVKIPVSVIWTSIQTGIFGLVLQWTFLPLIVYYVENRGNRER